MSEDKKPVGVTAIASKKEAPEAPEAVVETPVVAAPKVDIHEIKLQLNINKARLNAAGSAADVEKIKAKIAELEEQFQLAQ